MRASASSSRCDASSRRPACTRSSHIQGCRVCRMHGARGGAPTGKGNGNYRHGTRTKEAISWEISQLAVTVPGNFEKTASTGVGRVCSHCPLSSTAQRAFSLPIAAMRRCVTVPVSRSRHSQKTDKILPRVGVLVKEDCAPSGLYSYYERRGGHDHGTRIRGPSACPG